MSHQEVLSLKGSEIMLCILVEKENINIFKVVDGDAPKSLAFAESECLLEAIAEAIDLFDGEELVELNYRCYKCSTCPLREEE